jgi:hypothetical protein
MGGEETHRGNVGLGVMKTFIAVNPEEVRRA